MDPKLRFYGFDMQEKTVSFTEAKAWLDKTAAEEAIRLDSLDQSLTKLSKTQGANLSEEALTAFLAIAQEIEALIQRLDDRRGGFGEAFECQRQNLCLLLQFATRQAEPRTEHKVRDTSMAANVNWILGFEETAPENSPLGRCAPKAKLERGFGYAQITRMGKDRSNPV